MNGSTSCTFPKLSAHDPLVRALYAIASPVGKYFQVEIHGIERIPKRGGVMLVGNHALLGVDTWALLPELMRRIERVPRGLALRKLFDIPVVGRTLERAGMVPGERRHAVDLLREEELVITYPGGARDSLKGHHERYKLKWDRRKGFAHVALRAQRPVQPIVGAGPDECFKLLLNRDGLLPMRGLSAQNTLKVPLFIPIARRIPFSFLVGDLITPPVVTPDTSKEEFDALASAFAKEVRFATQSLLDEHVVRYQSALITRSVRHPSKRERLLHMLRAPLAISEG